MGTEVVEKETLGSFYGGEVYIEKTYSMATIANDYIPQTTWRIISTCPWYKYYSTSFVRERNGVIYEETEDRVRCIGDNVLRTVKRREPNKHVAVKEGYGDW